MPFTVNVFLQDSNNTSRYIVKKELFRHPLVNRTMFKNNSSTTKMNKNTADTLYWLIVQAREQRDNLKFRVSNNYIKETVCCSYRSVSRYLKSLEDRGYIIRSSIINSDGKSCKKTNYFEICWLKLFEDFGENLFVDFMHNMITFIKNRIEKLKAFFKSAYRPLCHTDKPISSNEDIYIYIKENFKKSEEISIEQEVLLKGEYNDPLDSLLTENEPENRSYFNREIRICPDEWRKIAIKEKMSEEYIDDEFIEFRDYWLSLGQIKGAKKASWTRTWRNRIRYAINYYGTTYKRAKPTEEQWKSSYNIPNDQYSLISHTQMNITSDEIQNDCKSNLVTGLIDNEHIVNNEYSFNLFKVFYTVKAADVRDTKEGWLERWHKWNRRKGISLIVPKEKPSEIKITIPEKCHDIYETLLNKLGKGNYSFLIQDSVITQLDEPTADDDYILHPKSTFIYSRLKTPDVWDILQHLRINVIDPQKKS